MYTLGPPSFMGPAVALVASTPEQDLAFILVCMINLRRIEADPSGSWTCPEVTWFVSPSSLSYPGIQPPSACLEFSPIAARVRNSGEAGDRFHLNFSVHACAVVLRDFSFVQIQYKGYSTRLTLVCLDE
jgi:hypothetical protein